MIKLKDILNEISAKAGLEDVIMGRTTAIEGIKLSVGLADEIRSWLMVSPYGRRYGRQAMKGNLASILPIMNSYDFGKKLSSKLKREWKTLFAKHGPKRESVNEDAVATFTKELNGERIKAKVYTATGDGKTVEAQFTNKKWPDGVPVTKYLTRGGYKSIKTPRGKFKVIETEKFFYFEVNNGWAAVSRKRYTSPPFEY